METNGNGKKKKSGPKKKKSRKGKVGLLVAVLIVAVLLFSIIINALTSSVPAIVAQCAEAEVGNVSVVLDSNGTIESGEERTYFSPVGAKIESVPYEVGDVVSAGELLVKYDQDDVDNQYQTAKLNGTSSEYTYKDAVNKSSEASSDVTSLSSSISTLEKQIKSKESEVASIQSQISGSAGSAQTTYSSQVATLQAEQNTLNSESLELSKELVDITTELTTLKQQIEASEVSVEQDTTEITARYNELTTRSSEIEKRQLEISARLSVITTELSSVGTTVDTSSLEGKLTKAQSDLSKLQSDLAEKKSEKMTAESSILTSDAKKQMEASSNAEELSTLTTLELLDKAKEGITADFSGVVTSVSAMSGLTPMQGGELITIASLDNVKVSISVSKYDIGELKMGQKATITALDETYTGTVTKIGRMVVTNEAGNTNFEAEITLSSANNEIYLGVDATVKIEGETAKNVITVPTEAVNTSADGEFCYVVKDSIVTKQLVTTGLTSTEKTEITSGIEQGDVVITDVTSDIVEGAVVSVSMENTDVASSTEE